VQEDLLFRAIRRWERPGGLLLSDPPEEAKDIHDLCAFFWHLISRERRMIGREARLSPREQDAWEYAMQGGDCPYIAKQMSITRQRAHRLLQQACFKVARTPTIGILTVYWEEVHRHGYRTPRQESLHLVK
jgi:hypothetical protein